MRRLFLSLIALVALAFPAVAMTAQPASAAPLLSCGEYNISKPYLSPYGIISDNFCYNGGTNYIQGNKILASVNGGGWFTAAQDNCDSTGNDCSDAPAYSQATTTYQAYHYQVIGYQIIHGIRVPIWAWLYDGQSVVSCFYGHCTQTS